MRATLLLTAAALLTGCASVREVNEANLAAVADAGTTLGALTAGGVEANPLLSGTPSGVAGVLVLKLGLVQATAALEPGTRRQSLRLFTALWAGASFNNLIVLAGGTTPIGIAAAVGGAVWTWTRSEDDDDRAPHHP